MLSDVLSLAIQDNVHVVKTDLGDNERVGQKGVSSGLSKGLHPSAWLGLPRMLSVTLTAV